MSNPDSQDGAVLAIVTLIAVLATGLMAVANLRFSMRTSAADGLARRRTEALTMLRWAAEMAVDGPDPARRRLGIDTMRNLRDAAFVADEDLNLLKQTLAAVSRRDDRSES